MKQGDWREEMNPKDGSGDEERITKGRKAAEEAGSEMEREISCHQLVLR